MAAITPKQQRFVDEYLIDLNGTQAAIRAGYSKNTAASQATRLLINANVATAVRKAMERREKRTEITKDRVLQELAKIAFFDIRRLYKDDGSMKAPNELDDESASVLTALDVTEEFEGYGEEREMVGYTKKAKLADKVSALTLAMRHLGMLEKGASLDDDAAIPPIQIIIERRDARIPEQPTG